MQPKGVVSGIVTLGDGVPPGEDDASAEIGPRRKCLVTGEIRPKEELIRFVVGPGGDVVPDIEERLPGRGMWLSAKADVINTAVAKGLFSKAARRKVTAPADLRDRIEGLLTKRCVDLIGLARRAGQAVTGFEKVSAGLKSGTGGLVLAAHDAASGGRAQIQALARNVPVSSVLTGSQLGAAFGRDHAVHALLAAGRLAASLRRASDRLAGVKGAAVNGAGVKVAGLEASQPRVTADRQGACAGGSAEENEPGGVPPMDKE